MLDTGCRVPWPKSGRTPPPFQRRDVLVQGVRSDQCFSEDIDVTVFRDDIGEPATIEELDALSGKKRRARLDAIKEACQAYINGPLRADFTGKTSLLAGRVTMLLANGIAPRNIAAITFTELAAGELRVRVERFVNELLNGIVPDDLMLAFGEALTLPQIAALKAGRARLDELTATTIHGFCHKLLRSYAVEASVDPGAEVPDAVQTEFAFTTVFERWLRGRLGEDADPTDPVVVMARRDPNEAVETLKKLGKFRRDFRTAKPPSHDLEDFAERDFLESVREFRRWINGKRAPDRVARRHRGSRGTRGLLRGCLRSPSLVHAALGAGTPAPCQRDGVAFLRSAPLSAVGGLEER